MRDSTIPAPHESLRGDPHQKAAVVQMTMAEWKTTHRDFKGSCIGSDGKRWRCVLRSGGMVRVDIVKE